MKFRLIDSGAASAQKNMDLDAELLQTLDPEGDPILHFYDWDAPALTYGYFVKPGDFLRENPEITTGRRPTGGGIVFHTWDLAFSVLIPAKHPAYTGNTLEHYDYVNRKVLKAVEPLYRKQLELLQSEPVALDLASNRFCMAKATQYDVMLGPLKVAGAAQRTKAQGFLHQGSISLAAPDKEVLEKSLLPGTRVLEAMLSHSAFILDSGWRRRDLQDLRIEVRESLKKVFL